MYKRYTLSELEGYYFFYSEEFENTVGTFWKGSVCYCEASEQKARTKLKMVHCSPHRQPDVKDSEWNWDSKVSVWAKKLTESEYPEYFL